MEIRRFTNPLNRTALITGLLLLLISIPFTSHAAKFYKWVDDDGVIRYGDKIPPNHAQKRQEILNDQGLVIETRSAAKTKKQLENERKRRQLAAESKRLTDEQAAKDRVLLDTYSTEDEIISVRDNKIEALDGTIRLAESRISKGQVTLSDSKRLAAKTERSGQTVSENLNQSIKNSRSQIRDNEAFIKRQNEERERIMKKHNADLAHFRDLMHRFNKPLLAQDTK